MGGVHCVPDHQRGIHVPIAHVQHPEIVSCHMSVWGSAEDCAGIDTSKSVECATILMGVSWVGPPSAINMVETSHTHTLISRGFISRAETLGFPWQQQKGESKQHHFGSPGDQREKPHSDRYGIPRLGFLPSWQPSFVGQGQLPGALAPCRFFIVRDPGRHTHTKPRWGEHKRKADTTPNPTTANTNHTEGIPPGDRQKPRGNGKRFSKTTNPSTQNQAEGIPPGDRKKPRGNSKKKIQGRTANFNLRNETKQREFHQGTAKTPRQRQKFPQKTANCMVRS